MFPAFDPSSNSLVKKHLTPAIFKSLHNLTTASGFTLEGALASGIANPDSSIGLYAGDAQSYQTFAALFDPIIQDYHQVTTSCHHQSDLGPINLPNIDPDNQYVLSCRIRVARSLSQYPFTNSIDLGQRKTLEEEVIGAFHHLEDELRGEYVSLERPAQSRLTKVQQDTLLFKKGDRFQDAAGMNTDFPEARGVFLSDDHSFRVWVNEEDHLRIISLSRSSDLIDVYRRFKRGLSVLDNHLEYETSERYGFLNACPTNIGTAMRAGVHIRLKNLEKHPDVLKSVADDHQLQIRGTKGEKTRVEDGIFDISNKRRLGITEKQIIQLLYAGVKALIQAEKSF